MVHPHPRITSQRFRTVLDTCDPYVVGTYDLSATGGPEHTVLVQGRSAAHVRKLATRVSDGLAAPIEGRAPDGSDAWVVIDGGDVVTHVLTDGALRVYGLGALFNERSSTPEDVFAVALAERLERRPA